MTADGSRYVLPNADDSGPADPKYITRSAAQCLKRFRKHGVAAFTSHDLRRTGRTGLARLGVKVAIAERVLNHTRERIEATYDVHEYVDGKREALERWGKVSGGPSRWPQSGPPVDVVLRFAMGEP